MTKEKSTTNVHNGYSFRDSVFELTTLTSDPLILNIAGRLQRQWRRLDKAHQRGVVICYKPIHIPKILQHIFDN